MKSLTLFGTLLTATLVFTACDPKRQVREKPSARPEQKTEPKEKKLAPGSPEIDPDGDTPPKPNDNVEIKPKTGNVPPPPAPEGKEEYAVKVAGQTGFVTDPHDPQGRKLDVRGMPPGTKIQSPFSGSVLLVPPQ